MSFDQLVASRLQPVACSLLLAACGLKSKPYRPKYSEGSVAWLGKGGRKYPPYTIDTEHMEDIIDAGTKFEIGLSIEGLECISILEIQCAVRRRQMSP